MRRSYIMLLLLLICPSCFAQVPLITASYEHNYPTAPLSQIFDLWITSEGEWQVIVDAPRGLRFAQNGGGQQILAGQGSGVLQLNVQLVVQLDYLGSGCHCLDLEVSLEGAQGILGLALPEQYWIMPLNCPDAILEQKNTQRITLNDECWYPLELGNKVFCAQKQVSFFETEIDETVNLSLEKEGYLGWSKPGLSLESGEFAQVALRLTGPISGGTVRLCGTSEIFWGEQWVLQPQGFALATCHLGNDLLLEVPALDIGEYSLEGAIGALLPAQAKSTIVEAHLHGQRALLNVFLSRDWFDFSGDVSLKTNLAAGSKVEFLLPDGAVRPVDGGGRIKTHSSGLGVVVPLNQPERPLWFGFPLAESLSWILAVPERGSDTSDFFLPMFFWDDGFSWRLVSQRGDWFCDVGSAGQAFSGRIGSLCFSTHDGRISLWQKQDICTDGHWSWSAHPETRRGIWRKDGFFCSIDLPRRSGIVPDISVGYSGEKLNWQLAADDISFRYKGVGWACGGRFSSGSLWFDLVPRSLRLEIRRDKICLRKRTVAGRDWQLDLAYGGSWQFLVKDEKWQAYLANDEQNQKNWGWRWKCPVEKDKWRLLSTVALQGKGSLVLSEFEQQVGYLPVSNCLLYVRGALQGGAFLDGSLVQFSLDYGVGLVYFPWPQMMTELSWQKSSGLKFRAGVVIPFVGKNRPEI